MSKMSQLHVELTEQANQLGFETIEEAEANGYEVDYEKQKLVDSRQLAHEAWVREKEGVLQDLASLSSYYMHLADAGDRRAKETKDILENTINFIMKGEM